MSLLNQVKTKKIEKALAILFYGVHGIGKTSFAAGAENPIFIGVEANDEFDVPRFPQVKTWKELTDQLSAILNEKHDFKTVVIDTIDGLEDVAQKEILAQYPKKTMETAAGGYGKAYAEMESMFFDLRDNYLAKILDKGIQVIILAHSEKTKFEDPVLAISYDTYSTASHKKVKPIFQDWVSCILFARYDLIKAENAQGKEYAESMGNDRVIFTEERPSHIGKNRFGLPYEIKFEKEGAFSYFKKLISEYYGKKPEEQKEIIESSKKKELLDLISKIEDDAIRGSAEKSAKKAITESEIERLILKVRSL